MVFNATFNNISVISWRSVLFVEETGENHRPVASHWQTLSHNVVHLAMSEIWMHISGDRHWLQELALEDKDIKIQDMTRINCRTNEGMTKCLKFTSKLGEKKDDSSVDRVLVQSVKTNSRLTLNDVRQI